MIAGQDGRVYLACQSVKRAETDGALATEATRLRVELALESHDRFFRGHDQTLVAEVKNPRK